MEAIVKFDDGSSYTYEGIPEGVTPADVTLRAEKEFGRKVVTTEKLDGGKKAAPVSVTGELGKVADKGVRGGLLALPQLFDLLTSGPQFLGRKLSEAATGTPVEATSKGKSDLMKVLTLDQPGEGLLGLTGGALAKPETTAGKYAGTILEGALGAVAGPGGAMQPVRNAVIGAASGASSEGSAKLFGDNTLSRILGGLVGGGLTAGAGALVPNANKLMKQAVGQVPEADWRRAGKLNDIMEGLGISRLQSQLLGPSSTLDDLAAVVATHPSTRPGLISAVKNSPEQSRKAFDLWSMQHLPPNLDSRRQVLNDIQGSADEVISGLKNKANQAYANELPPGVNDELYDANSLKALKQELTDLAHNTDYYGPNTAGGKAILNLADNGLPTPLPDGTPKGYVNNLLKDLNTLSMTEGYKGLPVQHVKDIIRRFTDADYGSARAAKQSVMEGEVNAAQKGLTGQLAEMGGGVRPDKVTAKETALNLVFPELTPQPNEIIKLGKDMGGEPVGQMLREYLAKNMEKAVRLKPESQGLQAPFSFVQAVAGTNAQRQNLEAALTVIAKDSGSNPAAVRNGFYRLMKAFETTSDLRLPASVDRTTLSQQAGMNIPGLLVAPQSRLGRVLWERATEKSYKKIAEVLTSKDGVKTLERLAKSKDPKAFQALTRSLMATSGIGDDVPPN